MSLKEVIEGYLKGPAIEPSDMRPSDVAKRVAALDARFNKLPALLPEERHELLIRIRNVAAGGDWSSVTARDLRRSAELLFAGDARLAQMPGFLKGYLGAIAVNASVLPRLISVYCMHFDLKDAAIREIAAFLVSNLARLPPVWAERHQSAGLFDPDQAPSRIANNLSDVAAPAEALGELGLAGRRGSSGLAAHVFLRVTEVLRRRLEERAALDDVKQIIRWGSPDGKTLVFESERRAMAHALLLPWRKQAAPLPLRREIERFLLSAFKDPRLHPGQWGSIDDAAKIIIRRWLAENSLEQFLRVVDRVAPTYQWTHRRAFWNAYFKKGYVLDAWVAFGRDGAKLARSVAADRQEDAGMVYGELYKPPNSKQAVLLLRIGDLLVADWSHLGSVRIWRGGNDQAPQLYAPHYSTSSLRHASDFEDTHDQHGHWQAQTHAFIERHTGIRLQRSAYMP